MMKTIAVDFDGVIHGYSKGWQDGEIYDPPIEGAFEGIMELYKEGYTIIIFTARTELELVRKWFWKYYDDIFPKSEHIPIEITNKKPPALWYIDDKAITFYNWSETLSIIHTMEKEELP